ncbi:hypothetical protein OXYTRIMIC_803 [Oxytricha trifallax]|uniref:Uncharacterized protein n=1 Tax=Oxytricha trifallax TaxID=1172189 RepID=A0A073HZI5_9SPIT|nr:hypothetical protein OXYTRIMIC_803 [Oxytricha trifallax]
METNQVRDPEDCGVLATLIINHLLRIGWTTSVSDFAKDWLNMQRYYLMFNLEVGFSKMEIGRSGKAISEEETIREMERKSELIWQGADDEMGTSSYTMTLRLTDGTNQSQGKLQEDNQSKNSLNVKGDSARQSRKKQQWRNTYSRIKPSQNQRGVRIKKPRQETRSKDSKAKIKMHQAESTTKRREKNQTLVKKAYSNEMRAGNCIEMINDHGSFELLYFPVIMLSIYFANLITQSILLLLTKFQINLSDIKLFLNSIKSPKISQSLKKSTKLSQTLLFSTQFQKLKSDNIFKKQYQLLSLSYSQFNIKNQLVETHFVLDISQIQISLRKFYQKFIYNQNHFFLQKLKKSNILLRYFSF